MIRLLVLNQKYRSSVLAWLRVSLCSRSLPEEQAIRECLGVSLVIAQPRTTDFFLRSNRMASAYLPLKKTVYIFLFNSDGSRELWPVLDKPNGFGNYQQAFMYILTHPEVPGNAGVVELYSRG